MKGFTFDDTPGQTGRTALVTGANTGIGYHIAEMLADRGARVLMGCRDLTKAEAARKGENIDGRGSEVVPAGR